MGTTWSVKLASALTAPVADDLRLRIEDELGFVNGAMSTYLDDSALSRFNSSPSTEWQPVPAELAQLVNQARDISELSGGAFDVTIGSLVNLWGFGPDASSGAVPEDASVAHARSLVGYRKLDSRLAPAALRKSVAGLYVDLSAIAKGYAVDRIAQLLQDRGLDDFLVEIGGELRGRGRNASGKVWRIAIEKPDGRGRAVHQVVELADAGMATSGDYRNFFVDGGRRYSHTIDISTGRPVRHSLASVTVIAADCTRADGLATALLAMGPDAGFALAEQVGIAALFIERTDDGFKDRVTTPFTRAVEEAKDNA